jgi:acyl-coenzyme A synthetase/AMP-(fatty) acid ligase
MYGLTECKRVSILLPGERATRPGSVGRPLDGTSTYVADESGNSVPNDEPGELVVSGPHVTLGYWRQLPETLDRFGTRDGHRFLRTGDTFRMDPDGYLYFLGRCDAQIKRHGYRMSLLELEDAALRVPNVAHAAATFNEDLDRLELFVQGVDDEVNADTILRSLRVSLENYKLPDRVSMVAAMPLGANGKVDRAMLQTPMVSA